MKLIVCIKQVPDTTGKAVVNSDGTLDRSSMRAITNPDDMNALEAALQLKDNENSEVIVITMGPLPAQRVLTEALAMGADRAILISSREFGGSDTFATAQILAAAIQKIGFEKEDIIFCGRQAIDGDTAQVGPQIAEKLNIPQITYVADIQKKGSKVLCKRVIEDGYMEIETKTPCLLTCIKELNSPRYMTMKGIREACEKFVEIFDYNILQDEPLIEKETIGLLGSPTNIFRSFTPLQKKNNFMLKGSAQEMVDELGCFLQEKNLI